MVVCPKSLKTVINKKIRWLWKPYVAFGKVTLIQGKTGIGKTSLVIKIIADLSNGIYPPTMFRRRLQRSVKGAPIKTYYVTVENGMDDTVAPLFDMYKGNREWVEFQNEEEGHFELTTADIEECVARTGAQLIVVDPWQQFLGNASSTDNKAVRAMICEIQATAERLGVAIVLAGNFTKGIGDDIQRSMGASEMANTLRCILTIHDDPDGDPTVRIMEPTKMSLLEKEMTPVVIRQDDDWNLWFEDLEGEMEYNLDDPVVFLQYILRNGPLDSKDVKRLGEENGMKMNRLYYVREKAGVVIEGQPDRTRLWKLK